jgi:hypothetical protein
MANAIGLSSFLCVLSVLCGLNFLRAKEKRARCAHAHSSKL